MLPGGSRPICTTLAHVSCGLDLSSTEDTDPAQPIIAADAGCTAIIIDYLDPDIFPAQHITTADRYGMHSAIDYLYDLYDLLIDHDLSEVLVNV